jgi:hypothetical protein
VLGALEPHLNGRVAPRVLSLSSSALLDHGHLTDAQALRDGLRAALRLEGGEVALVVVRAE